MSKRVSVEGRIIEVPDDATPDEIDQIAGGNGQSAPEQSAFSRAATNFRNGITGPEGLVEFGKGAVKGAMSTVGNTATMLDRGANAVGLGALTTPKIDASVVNRAKPTNSAQRAGKTAEQVGEFFIPGGAEDAAIAKMGGGLLPSIATKAIGSGMLNKAQGGSFSAGAIGGGVGEGVLTGLKAIAPSLAETALRVRGADRDFGATPGQAILDKTTSIMPSKVATQARSVVSANTAAKEALAAAHPNPINLSNTLSGVNDAVAGAAKRNNKSTIKAVGELSDQLTKDATTGAALPIAVTPDRAVALQRGLGDLKTSWNPATVNEYSDAAVGGAYHTLGNSIADEIPAIRPLNQETASLLPVIKRGNAVAQGAGMAQRVAGRVAAHTGALTLGVAGYQHAGIPGAIAGVVGPELLGSPEVQLAAARIANSAGLRKALPAINGYSQQFFGRDQ